MKLLSCAFTGHRPKKFPWGYKENMPECIALMKALNMQFSSCFHAFLCVARTEKFSNIYLSSQPVEIAEGVFCEYWQFVSYGTFGTFQGVYPYQDGWPGIVNTYTCRKRYAHQGEFMLLDKKNLVYDVFY